MNTCSNCKWHGAPREHARGNEKENGGPCTNPKLYEAWDEPENEKEHSRDHLVYSYSEGGGFWTGDDFGCVHYEITEDMTR